MHKLFVTLVCEQEGPLEPNYFKYYPITAHRNFGMKLAT